MAKLLKLRRGTTSQHSSFTGAEGEVTVDTDKESLVVHNGSTAGGFAIARADSPDNQKTRWGTGNDLSIFHDGSHSYVEDSGTGDLRLKGSTIRFRSTASESMIGAFEHGAVEIYYDNSKKLETTSAGAKVSGEFLIEGDTKRLFLRDTRGTGNTARPGIWMQDSASSNQFFMVYKWVQAT